MHWRIEFQLETSDTVSQEEIFDFVVNTLQRAPHSYGAPAAISVTDKNWGEIRRLKDKIEDLEDTITEPHYLYPDPLKGPGVRKLVRNRKGVPCLVEVSEVIQGH
jgi:hypothetical protein